MQNEFISLFSLEGCHAVFRAFSDIYLSIMNADESLSLDGDGEDVHNLKEGLIQRRPLKDHFPMCIVWCPIPGITCEICQ